MFIESQLQKGKYVVVMILITSLLISSNMQIQPSNGLTNGSRWVSSEDDLSSVEQIFINGNSDFLLVAQHYGWPGQGTFEYPILIQYMIFPKMPTCFQYQTLTYTFSSSITDLTAF